VKIGDPERTYTIEPLEDPVSREPSEAPKEIPMPPKIVERQKVEAE
jgi:hypothetical protein